MSEKSDKRLIEAGFPLKQTSLDSVHEKNVRHGHISTLHIWPARRPLAASRAALIATLLKDPEDPDVRRQLLNRLGGTLEKEETETKGGILHWGRETSPDLQWFRDQIRETYGGRAPRVLDPFAGGGAIPLEAMRLGCEVTAADINPVAWFILKCTLEYPQRLSGKKLPLPSFVRQSEEFVSDYLQAKGVKPKDIPNRLAELGIVQHSHKQKARATPVQLLSQEKDTLWQADLAWHVRAWGFWVLQQAREDLQRFYPVIDKKPTVAYLWARTVVCRNCRATIPLLKTRWLCKKENKRIVLTMEPNAEETGVIFGILNDTEPPKGSTAQRNAHDKKLGGGTMSRSGVACPCCRAIMRMEEIRSEGLAGRLGTVMTAVVVEGENSKGYRLPTNEEIAAAHAATQEVEAVFADIPFGLPEEPLPGKESPGFRVPLYGFDKWHKLFTPRQLVALGTFVKHTRAVRDVMRDDGYDQEWIEVISVYLALIVDRSTERNSSICHYDVSRDSISGTFQRYALPINWDFAEAFILGSTTGGYKGQIDWVARYIEHSQSGLKNAFPPKIINESVLTNRYTQVDIIVTDPPYYDAIPYSDLMDFFYIWLRRSLYGLSDEIDLAFRHSLAPKWDHDKNDGELIDDSSRFQGNKQASKKNYEDGMYRAFQACYQALVPDGRLVIVFAHKHPDAWETLVSAIIRAGFVVDGSWPIQTEMGNRTRALSSAALASSVWLVCKKRPRTARPGWDHDVLAEMRANIREQLRDFWDADIRGPDFVWAATGPAMEAYSKYPVVKKADRPDELLTVSEFLRQVRRIVLDFVIGYALMHEEDESVTSGLDDVTSYYLLHRNDFKMESAPVGPCILYAVSCGLKDSDLLDRYDILARSGGQALEDEEDGGEEGASRSSEREEGTKSKVRLKVWTQRKRPDMGYSTPQNKTVPMIDQIHRLMHLWEARDQSKLDDYINEQGLGQNPLFARVLQAVVELAPEKSDERSLLESISNHLKGPNGRSKKKETIQQQNLFESESNQQVESF